MPSVLYFKNISFLVLLLVLLFSHSTIGRVEVIINNGVVDGAHPEKDNGMKKKMDIMDQVDAEIAYEDPGSYPGYDPRKGKPGTPGGGRIVRKLIAEVEARLDYDYGGPNPRHDPRKGKPGGGGW